MVIRVFTTLMLVNKFLIKKIIGKVGLGLIRSKNLWLGVQFNWLFLGYF